MSADLFAAFGQPQPSRKVENKALAEGQHTDLGKTNVHRDLEESDQWILQSRPIQNLPKQGEQRSLWKQDSEGANVLFNASDDDQDGDDFGDFEDATNEAERKEAVKPSSTHWQSHQTSMDLLGLDDFSNMQITQTPNSNLTSNNRNITSYDLLGMPQAAEYHVNQHQAHPRESQSTWVQPKNREDFSEYTGNREPVPPQMSTTPVDEDWGNFEDAETDAASKQNTVEPTSTADLDDSKGDPAFEDDQWDTFEDISLPPIAAAAQRNTTRSPTHLQPDTTTSHPSQPQPRPTNIPPPSTLLQLLPQIYQLLAHQSRQPNPPPTLAPHILQIYTTTARLISGRTHRWKRDTHLSQSMRISSAGLKSTGMKLTALDRSEAVKEDQDAQESISAWLRHAAVLNAVMLKAKVPKPPMSLSQNMAVRTAAGPDVLTARECCAVCGLKRNERVTGVDVRVDDTFGEFWVEYWGHRDCYEFWYQYEELLSKR